MRNTGQRLIVAAALLLSSGCVAVVKAPAEPEDPRPTYVLEHGRHTSLVLTSRNGTAVRYAFGELDWYAHNNTGLFRGMSALLTPTSGTLGRRELTGPATPQNIRESAGVGIETIHCMAASAKRVDRLGQLLDSIFNENRSTLHFNRAMNLEFVDVPEKFWFGNNSNQAAAGWLEKLDAEVSGTVMFANWRLAHPDDEPPAACQYDVADEGSDTRSVRQET